MAAVGVSGFSLGHEQPASGGDLDPATFHSGRMPCSSPFVFSALLCVGWGWGTPLRGRGFALWYTRTADQDGVILKGVIQVYIRCVGGQFCDVSVVN